MTWAGSSRIESDVEVPALHNFVSQSLWHPHVIVRSADPKASWPLKRSSKDLIAPAAAAVAGIRINMTDPIEVELRDHSPIGSSATSTKRSS